MTSRRIGAGENDGESHDDAEKRVPFVDFYHIRALHDGKDMPENPFFIRFFIITAY